MCIIVLPIIYFAVVSYVFMSSNTSYHGAGLCEVWLRL